MVTNIICSCFFIIFRILLLLKYNSYFGLDEFYHIGDVSENFINIYRRAGYINDLVKIMGSIIDNNYYAVKIIPISISIICFLILLFLMNQIYEKKASLYLGTFVLSFSSLFIFNSLYVRMYIFIELFFTINLLIHYLLIQEKKIWKKIIYIIIYCFITYFYYHNTSDQSTKLYLGVMIVGLVVNLFYKIIFKVLSTHKLYLWLMAGFCFALIISVYMAPIVKMILLPDNYDKSVHGLHSYFREQPVFLIYFLTQGIVWTVTCIVSYMYIMKKKVVHMFPIWCYIYSAFLVTLLMLHSSYFFRGFAPYLGAQTLFLVWMLEQWKIKKITIFSIAVCLATVWMSYPNLNIKAFYKNPIIPNETNLSDYSEVINEYQKIKQEEIDCIFMYAMIEMEYFFQIDEKNGYSIRINTPKAMDRYEEEFYIDMLQAVMDSKKPIVVFIDRYATERLLVMDIYYELLGAATSYKDMGDYKFIIYFNCEQ